jgi:hypothetical protein
MAFQGIDPDRTNANQCGSKTGRTYRYKGWTIMADGNIWMAEKGDAVITDCDTLAGIKSFIDEEEGEPK